MGRDKEVPSPSPSKLSAPSALHDSRPLFPAPSPSSSLLPQTKSPTNWTCGQRSEDRLSLGPVFLACVAMELNGQAASGPAVLKRGGGGGEGEGGYLCTQRRVAEGGWVDWDRGGGKGGGQGGERNEGVVLV